MNHRTNTRRTNGFTLIELMLSMAFVAVLLLAIAMTIIQMANIYNRGMTLKEVNLSSRDIADDLRRTFTSSQPFVVNADGTDSSDYIRVRSGSAVVGGRLCTGTYSYVWNIGEAVDRASGPDTNISNILTAGGTVKEPVRFVKVIDSDKKYCQKTSGAPAHKNIVDADAQKMTNLLDAGDHKLALQTFDVTTADAVSDPSIGQRLFTVTYTISSGEPSAMDLVARPIRCLDPGMPNANLAYCNVQEFTIVLRVGNTVN